MRARLQQAGAFLAGWVPNQHPVRLVEPMILFLLPILIGFSGGRLVCGIRGGVVGAVATMGVVAGSSVPMFRGAAILGPWAAGSAGDLTRPSKRACPSGLKGCWATSCSST